MKKTLALFLSFCIIAGGFCLPAYADGDEIKARTKAIIQTLYEENGCENASGYFERLAVNDDAGSAGLWYALSIYRYLDEKPDCTAFISFIETHFDEYSSSVVTGELAALTLKAFGSNSSLIERAADEYPEKLGIMSLIYGLHLLTAGAKSRNYTAEILIDKILACELPGGGFAVFGDSPDTDVTAMSLQALAPYRGIKGVDDAITRGLDLLCRSQTKNGGYKAMGQENAESAAQVLTALCALGIDAQSDERFIKNGNTVFDFLETFYKGGRYSHTADGNGNDIATRQVLMAYVSYCLMQRGDGSFFVFSSDKTAAGGISLKTALYIVTAALAAAAALICFLLKKRSFKTYLLIVIIAAAAAAAITFLNFSSAGDYYGSKKELSGSTVNTTVSIYCDTIAGEKDFIPEDGIILENAPVVINDGDTAYDQIVAAARQYSLSLETKGASSDAYVSGLAFIYEFDFGELSGWMFKINGKFSDVGCSSVVLSEGDLVEWVYTRNLGKDVGDTYSPSSEP